MTATDCLVGLETAHNLPLDLLWDHGYQQIYVIPPLVIKNSRGRYGHSAAQDDTLDAQDLPGCFLLDGATFPQVFFRKTQFIWNGIPRQDSFATHN